MSTSKTAVTKFAVPSEYRWCTYTAALWGILAWPGLGWSQTPAATATAETSSQADDGTPDTDKTAGETPAETHPLLIDENHLQMMVPARWQMVKPRNNLIEIELAILPKDAEGDGASARNADQRDPALQGRLTMMAAGGDVDANIRRWVGQFRLGRDADGKDAMQRDRRLLRGAVVHVLDIAGTYFDSPQGPFGPKVERPDFRMLGAIIEVQGSGKYFVKFYGPAKIIEENREAFEAMLSSLEVVAPPTESEPPATAAPPQQAAS